MMYLKRCGRDRAIPVALDFEHQVQSMVADSEQERKIRMICSPKGPRDGTMFPIFPLKRPSPRHIEEEEPSDDEENVDAYKIWLQDLQKENPYTGAFCYPLYVLAYFMLVHKI